jgi:hypothetical protein
VTDPELTSPALVDRNLTRRLAGAVPGATIALRVANAVTVPVRRSPLRALRAYPSFLRQRRDYRRLGGPAPLTALRPELFDALATHQVDHHYLQQGAWAMRAVLASRPDRHVDVGGQTNFVGMVAAAVPVEFVDIRPLGASVPGVVDRPGSVLDLPYGDGTVPSISCLHVVEHVGLGRYGDPLDPAGSDRALAELRRVLAPGGDLYLGLPVGATRTEFNAHRVHRVRDVLALLGPLDLVSFALVDDMGTFHDPAPTSGWDGQRYALGLFHLRA